jgi:hypothetical protein
MKGGGSRGVRRSRRSRRVGGRLDIPPAWFGHLGEGDMVLRPLAVGLFGGSRGVRGVRRSRRGGRVGGRYDGVAF